ncbi:aldehyde reductase [Cytophagaceae bacterium YF14B1]|uniref:Aldehyde reductase n=1 Tax=Xanthocytophaga flava TaxID=3048013 RepID=A0AAE3QS00_9BACT|nr:aldehyde reductase [Xanthocytophaga flavus]MDJ1481764.1 aldehyde reductase [Xanthocytophaga flavus]
MKTNKTVLVTGGTGFVGIHTLLQLVQQGYTVKTTIRRLNKKEELEKALRTAGIESFENLSIYEADLLYDIGWSEAVKGCDYVLHVASPFVTQEPKDENELIIPAREGSLRVLRASRDAGVKRVVLTSSFAAIGYSTNVPGHVFTEEDWTDPNVPLMAYIKSKTIAEQAAWEFMRHEGGTMELSVINPVGIFGPMIGGISSASLDGVVKNIIGGLVTSSPNFTFGVVDVRDVADIHIRAMEHPQAAGQRFLAASEGVMSFYDVAELLRKERPEYAGKIASLPNTDQNFYITLSTQKAKDILDWKPRSKEEAILASVDSMMN